VIHQENVRYIFAFPQSLKWQLDEQQNELEAARERLHLVEDRHKMEVESLQTSLQVGSVSTP